MAIWNIKSEKDQTEQNKTEDGWGHEICGLNWGGAAILVIQKLENWGSFILFKNVKEWTRLNHWIQLWNVSNSLIINEGRPENVERILP